MWLDMMAAGQWWKHIQGLCKMGRWESGCWVPPKHQKAADLYSGKHHPLTPALLPPPQLLSVALVARQLMLGSLRIKIRVRTCLTTAGCPWQMNCGREPLFLASTPIHAHTYTPHTHARMHPRTSRPPMRGRRAPVGALWRGLLGTH